MTAEREAWRPRRKWRRHRYYKVQRYEERSKTWRDFKQAFDDLTEAQRFAAEYSASESVRIMWVEGNSRGVIEGSSRHNTNR
jgi:hypothetical protein